MRPRGFHVVLAGPDGVGKTSLRFALSESLSVDYPVVSHRNDGPVVLKRASAANRWEWLSGVVQRSRLLSELKVIYLYIDRLLGAWLVDRPSLAAGKWVIGERGWWDLAVFPERYRIRPNTLMVRVLSPIAPRPDLILILEADADVVFQRKQERSIAELERQMTAWRSVLPSYQPHAVLDSSLPPADLLENARSTIQSVGGMMLGGDDASVS